MNASTATFRTILVSLFSFSLLCACTSGSSTTTPPPQSLPPAEPGSKDLKSNVFNINFLDSFNQDSSDKDNCLFVNPDSSSGSSISFTTTSYNVTAGQPASESVSVYTQDDSACTDDYASSLEQPYTNCLVINAGRQNSKSPVDFLKNPGGWSDNHGDFPRELHFAYIGNLQLFMKFSTLSGGGTATYKFLCNQVAFAQGHEHTANDWYMFGSALSSDWITAGGTGASSGGTLQCQCITDPNFGNCSQVQPIQLEFSTQYATAGKPPIFSITMNPCVVPVP